MEFIDKLFNRQKEESWLSKAADEAKEVLEKGAEYVKKNPEKSAFATGAATGAAAGTAAIAAGLGALALARKLRRLKKEPSRKFIPKSVSK